MFAMEMERPGTRQRTSRSVALLIGVTVVLGLVSLLSPWTQLLVSQLVEQPTTAKTAISVKYAIPQTCSCDMAWNDSLTPNQQTACCRRTMLLVHKMGTHAMRKITQTHFRHFYTNYSPTERILYLTTNLEEYREMLRTAHDARSIIVTRHWTDALISGYLYHRTGRECWLDNKGQYPHDNFAGLRPMGYDYDKHVLEKSRSTFAKSVAPRFQGRDLCRYLADESEEVGMRVYTEVALAFWYRKLLEIGREQQSQVASRGRTLFLCYEDATQAATYVSTVETMAHFLFPTLVGPNTKEWKSMTLPNGSAGGHGTSHDATLRKRLASTVESYDREFLSYEIAKGSVFFGCQSELE